MHSSIVREAARACTGLFTGRCIVHPALHEGSRTDLTYSYLCLDGRREGCLWQQGSLGDKAKVIRDYLVRVVNRKVHHAQKDHLRHVQVRAWGASCTLQCTVVHWHMGWLA